MIVSQNPAKRQTYATTRTYRLKGRNSPNCHFYTLAVFHKHNLALQSPRRFQNLCVCVCDKNPKTALGHGTIQSGNFRSINRRRNCLHNLSRDQVWICIGRRSAIFKVSLALGFGIPSNPNRRSAIGDTK